MPEEPRITIGELRGAVREPAMLVNRIRMVEDLDLGLSKPIRVNGISATRESPAQHGIRGGIDPNDSITLPIATVEILVERGVIVWNEHSRSLASVLAKLGEANLDNVD